MAPVTIGCTLT